MSGRLIAVVGPSGVGKDSVMAGMVARDPSLRLVQRTITRPPELGGEDYKYLAPQTFADAAARGAYSLYWDAHGLSYGIPAKTLTDVQSGHDCLANLSRGVLLQAARVFPSLIVLHITAHPEVLATRLAERGRETSDDIASRLQQADKPLPEGLKVVTVENNGTLEAAIEAACTAIQPVSV